MVKNLQIEEQLAQRMSRADVVAQPKAADLLADPSMTARLMQGFKHIFGKDADKIVQSALDEARQCHDTAFEALKTGEDQKEVAHRLNLKKNKMI